MRATESFILANNVAGASVVPVVSVVGGRYMVLAHGTLGTTPTLQVADSFGNWYTVTSSLAADTPQVVELPAAQVRANLASGASGAYVTIARIPGE